jgi:hypothetical protein
MGVEPGRRSLGPPVCRPFAKSVHVTSTILYRIESPMTWDLRFVPTFSWTRELHQDGPTCSRRRTSKASSLSISHNCRLPSVPFSQQASDHARTAHNKALAAGLAPDKRIAFLSALSWRIAASPDGGSLLPDRIALAEDDDEGSKPLMLADLEHVRTVYMALSPDKLLVRLRTTARIGNLADFNAAAAASQTFFISASQDDRFAVLANRIGTCVKDYVDRTIRQIFDEFWRSGVSSPELQQSARL